MDCNSRIIFQTIGGYGHAGEEGDGSPEANALLRFYNGDLQTGVS